MKKLRYAIYGMILMFVLTLAGCKTTSSLHKNNDINIATNSVAQYAHRIIANAQTSKAITAKVKVRLQAEGKDISLNGNLKMMRDDVIQLSVNMLGFEIGRMEFTQDQVLIIDRIHRQYVQVPYNEVDFLRRTNIDFHVLQCIFWNEIFVPGIQDVNKVVGEFSMASSGDHTLLNLKSAPELEYSFLTETVSALLDRTSISPKNLNENGEFVCKYSQFTKVSGLKYPTEMELSFKNERKSGILSLALSNIQNNTDWNTRTQVSSRYKQMDAKDIFKKIMAE